MNLFLLAIAPGLAISFYIYIKDRYNREPAQHLVTCFLLGVLCAIPAVFIELAGDYLTAQFLNPFIPEFVAILVQAFIVVAFTEEWCKYVVMRRYAFPKPEFDEPFDGIVYSVMVSMGFATIENIGYVFEHGFGTGILRMFLSVPAHASFAILMGYYAGLAKFNTERKNILLMKGLWLAIAFHGLFDAFIFLSESKTVTAYVSAGLLITGGLASYIIALQLSARSIRLHRDLSEKMHNGLTDAHIDHI